MKVILYILLSISVLPTIIACKTDTKTNLKAIQPKKTTLQSKEIAKLEKMEFHIKGMTCEIGCARIIQSKLSKTKGITSSKVVFTDSIGLIEYDTNLVSKKDIINVVEQIAGGDLYKVTDYKTVVHFYNEK